MSNSLHTLQASSFSSDEKEAVAQLREKILTPETKLVLFFCTSKYNLPVLAEEIKKSFPCPVAGCTSAGHVDKNGYTDAKIIAIGLSGNLKANIFPIEIARMENDIAEISAQIQKSHTNHARQFGLLYIDGMSLMEEKVTSELYQALPMIPFIGGSAGDDLQFQKTHVYIDGAFRSGAAVFTLVETTASFGLVKFAHYQRSDCVTVVTEADPDKRLIKELDGEPAAEVYARMIGTTVDQLVANNFTQHPLALNLGKEEFMRDVYRANPDKSLSLFCSIEEGLVLSIANVTNPIETAQAAFAEVNKAIGTPEVILTCDCVSRKIDFSAADLTQKASELYSQNHVFGFCTYGEQYNGIHVNRTFTGIALAQPK